MTHRSMLRPAKGWRARAALVAALAAAQPACGAKTGLRAPALDADDTVVDAAAEVGDAIVLVRDVPTRLELTVQARIRVADLFLLVDNSGSMESIIRALTLNFSRTIVPGSAPWSPTCGSGWGRSPPCPTARAESRARRATTRSGSVSA